MEKSDGRESNECGADVVGDTDRVSEGIAVLYGLQIGHLVLTTLRRNNECYAVYDHGR